MTSQLNTYRLTWKPADANLETLTVRMLRSDAQELHDLLTRNGLGETTRWIATCIGDGRYVPRLYQLARITSLTSTDGHPIEGAPDRDRDVVERVTEEWFVQTRQPDGTWERSSSTQPTSGRGRERLAALQRRFPGWQHRLRHRTITVVDQTVPDDDTPPDTAQADA
ncbi:hypothetical protein E1265_00820 [Streptomyces sp. 8K308]|uniref:hypothetical protein n=1 Tax=Streptomyces sp. 8K308 TaxID=2530388 RepID=UPI00104E9F77|nr:hypothetical protein [Streptomyces sp. 8K308]TDC27689.1 hypothetical protein E1265_00820 [Streptomyces sp. 8K308]